ncbi:hypothetical protein F5B19DRAFT_505641 [Rostrohypoxylon terebratum]|nr:hypothetical protein F5B19DRAFT_505641 [Rostrohypoxylon terebratum]
MRAAQASRAAARAKALNLSVDTNVNTTDNGPMTMTHGPDISAEILTAPPSHPPFDSAGSKAKSSKPSQALANPNWRNRQLGPGAPLKPPMTAGLPQTEFQKSGGHISKQAGRPISPVNNRPARGYRTSPVDPDFIHSAPLTKKEYKGTNASPNGPQQGKGKDIHLTNQPPQDKLGVRALINLEPLSPNAQERFGTRDLGLKLEKENGRWVEKWTYGNCPLSAIPVTTANYTSLEGSALFPTAEVQSIKQSRRFQSTSWEDIDNDVQQEVSKLRESCAGNLPFSKPPEEHHAGNQMPPIDSTIKGPSTQTIEVKDHRYKSLIEKLNTPSDFSFSEGRQIREEFRSIGRRLKNEGSEGSDESKPSALTHLPASYSRANKTGKSLNPLATEFQFSSPTKDATSGPSGAIQHDRPSPVAIDKPKPQGIAGNDAQAILEMIGHLREEIAQLKASSVHGVVAKDVALQQQVDYLQSMANDMNIDPSHTVQSAQKESQMALVQMPWLPLEAHHDGTQLGSQQKPQQVAQQGSQQYGAQQHGSYTQPQASYPGVAPNQSYVYGAYDSTVVNGSVYNPYTFNGMPNYTGATYFPAPYGPQLLMAPAYGSSGQPTAPFGTIPNANLAQTAGPVSYGNLPLHQQAQIAFGPKPVTKPRVPPRIGDPNFAKHQQEYEEYLEIMRATNPEYARQCRDRQAKRAERHRSSRSSHPS